MVIKILGTGCANCAKLEQTAREAAGSLGIDAEFVKVTDFAEIMAYGVMSTPALVVDDEVKVAGRVPSVHDVATLLQGGSTSGGCSCGGCC